MSNFFWQKPQFGRRLLFKHAATAVGGYFLSPLDRAARAAEPIGKAKYCIFVLMGGGPSHVDTFDLKEGGWLPTAFAPASFEGVRWPQGLMPRIAEHLDSVALLRSVRSKAAVHELAQNWIQIGRNPVASTSRIAPHIGSVVARELSPQNSDKTLPPFLALNAAATMPANGYLPPENSPFFVTPGGTGLGNTAHRDGTAAFDRRYDLLLKLDAEERALNELGPGTREMAQFNLAARLLMYNSRVDAAFTFAADERLRYGNSGFGNACITARNLLRANLGVRFIQISVGGWDNHANIYTTLNPANANSLGRQFDTGLGTLLGDLKNDGLLQDTLVVAMGEFGRTVGTLNSQGGRDHFLQQSVFFAGAGIRGPRAIGRTDNAGSVTVETGWARDRDIRPEDIEATIYSALGIDWTKTDPNTPIGRAFEYVPKIDGIEYAPVHELWS
ncbi:MAG: DUF1501 domain-containing protein [Bryobacterales bacterium]|nr:DUF1501 domain-containing protein [Bryobacterales bacterium]